MFSGRLRTEKPQGGPAVSHMTAAKSLAIVPVTEIPTAKDCPLDALLPLYKTCLQMEQVCTKEQGIGLSAVQVGVPWKLYIVRYNDHGANQFRHFVNCEYEPVGEEKLPSLEGCLSIRNADGSLRHFSVYRFVRVKVTGLELVFDGKLGLKPISLELEGIFSIVHQHEIDHQRGVLISDIGTEYTIWKT